MKFKLLFSIFITLFAAQAHANKSFNIYTNLGFLYLGGNLGLDFKVGSNSTLGIIGTTYRLVSSSTTVTSNWYGARYNYYFSNAIASSFRLSLIGFYAPFRYSDGTYSSDQNVYIAEGLIGYHWVPGIINIAIGVGALYYSSQSTVILRNSSGATQTYTSPIAGVFPTLELTLGLAF